MWLFPPFVDHFSRNTIGQFPHLSVYPWVIQISSLLPSASSSRRRDFLLFFRKFSATCGTRGAPEVPPEVATRDRLQRWIAPDLGIAQFWALEFSGADLKPNSKYVKWGFPHCLTSIGLISLILTSLVVHIPLQYLLLYSILILRSTLTRFTWLAHPIQETKHGE